MNKKVLKTLEYDKILKQLAEFAYSAEAKEACLTLEPSGDLECIRTRQRNTSDALSRVFKKGGLSFSGIKDVRASMRRLEIGGSLGAAELLNVAKLLSCALRVRSYGAREDLSPDEYDSLDELFWELSPLSSLANEINRCIISEEELADDASAGLHSVRRNISSVRARIQSEMAAMLQSQKTSLQDPIITMRDGRYCLPVKSEYRSRVPGIIHDQSSTGSTVFVEPAVVVKLNNDLRQLMVLDQKEIEKVLAELSNLCANQIELIETDYRVLVQLDFIFAKAALSKEMKGTEPVFNADHIIEIKKGRHPLIPADKVVPIDVSLGESFDLLIVTGPNTGGKTVSLKTVGLFTLMGQAGLHIPAFDNSRLSVFREVFADIGDEQSIEQSLSTFSSHMTNIAPIIKNADGECLVLFDELGAGTDPTEGAALAAAILAFLHGLGICTMATTHYAQLKLYALSTPGVENACCEFDVETLRPTYRLLMGIPGKSNAFAISGKLGIPDYIIDDARKRMDTKDTNFEDVVSRLDESRRALEKEKEELEELRRGNEERSEALTRREMQLAQKQDKIIEAANERAKQMLAQTKSFVDETIRVVNKQTSGGEVARALEKERTKVRNRLDGVDKAKAKPKPEPGLNLKRVDPKSLGVGDRVFVTSMNLEGVITRVLLGGGEAEVQMGILKTRTAFKDLRLVSRAEANETMEKVPVGSMRMSKSFSVSPEINLIGQTTDEAIARLDKYLDDACLAGLSVCRIVHGKGTGALKNAVHQHLKKLKTVKEFRLGEYGEGDTGVTVVTFK